MSNLVQVKWKDREVMDALKRMRHHRGTFAPAFHDLKKHWREDLKAHAARNTGPDGKWEQRASSTTSRMTRTARGQGDFAFQRDRDSKRRTRSRKKRASKRNLLGKLPSAVTFRARKNSLLGVSKVAWSDIHNTGGRVGRGAVLPARPFLFVSDAFAKLAGERMAAFVVSEWGR